MKGEYVALAGRLQRQIADLEHVVDRAEHLVAKAQHRQDDDYLDGVALNLHGFYTGAERIFEDIARTLDRSLPTGAEWHRDLLVQMSAELGDVRPPVLESRTRECLEEYRGFRHVVRNVYTFNLHPARLVDLASALRTCYVMLKADIEAFATFLMVLSEDG